MIAMESCWCSFPWFLVVCPALNNSVLAWLHRDSSAEDLSPMFINFMVLTWACCVSWAVQHVHSFTAACSSSSGAAPTLVMLGLLDQKQHVLFSTFYCCKKDKVHLVSEQILCRNHVLLLSDAGTFGTGSQTHSLFLLLDYSPLVVHDHCLTTELKQPWALIFLMLPAGIAISLLSKFIHETWHSYFLNSLRDSCPDLGSGRTASGQTSCFWQQ